MECPNTLPLRILSRKWSFFALKGLQHPRSFSDLQRELRFITNRMLSRELHLLVGEGLVRAGRVYSLTDAGRDLLRATAPLAAWSVAHKQCVACNLERRCSSCQNYPDAIEALRWSKA